MRAWINEPVGVNLPVAGSYSSHEARMKLAPLAAGACPPTTRTRPSDSSVELCSMRSVLIAPVALNLPVAGLYSSGELTAQWPLLPPTISTRPSFSSVAV